MAQRNTHEPSQVQPPPPIRRRPARPLLLLCAAVALFSVLTWVVFNIDTGHERRAQERPGDDVIELIAPRGLSQNDLDRATVDSRSGIQPGLSKGGIIEIADAQTQELVQRYRFESLDPNPEGEAPGWLRMQRPRFEIFLENNRVVTIEGDSALAYRPHRAVESGTITDNVVVRLYEGNEGSEIDFLVDRPSWIVTTDEASLDNFLGEIRCDGWVLIESDTMTLPGRRLRLLIDDQSNRIDLRIAEPEYIRLVSNQKAAVVNAPPRGRSRQSTSPTAIRAHSTASARAVPASQTRIAPARRSPQFYLLTIEDEVVIKQGDRPSRRTANGDLLQVIFSTQTSGLETTLAKTDRCVETTNQSPMYGPMPLHDMIGVMALASFDSAAADEDELLLGPDITLIRCAGPLTIVPLDDSTRTLASPEDMRLELTGSPAVLRDDSNGGEAQGRVLAYQTGTELIELTGSPEYPLLVTSPQMDAGGERFFHSALANAGGFEGAGWMTHRDDDPSDETTRRTELHITWQRGMDLRFSDSAAGQRGSKLKSAHFDGDVKVVTDEFTLDAQQMTVGFAEDAALGGGDAMDAGSIEYIHAVGSVRVVGVANTSSIKSDDLHLDLARTASGNTIPKLLVALGDVEAIDDEQMIWSDSLRVSFIEGEGAKAQVDELLAERNVQVLLADGTRAFGDKLVGDGVSEKVELLGDDVTIISDKMIMDRGKRLVLDRPAGSATSPGPGSLRVYNEPVLEENRDRIERPRSDPNRTPELSADWSEAMHYDSKANHGAGSVDFRGDVDVVSNPTPLERNTMAGQSLTLVFERVAEAAQEEAGLDTDDRGRRDVRTLIARQDAKIESHTYATPDHAGEPSVFFISGDYVEYDTVTAEALVAGAGQLLIHDVTPVEDAEAAAATPFSSKGTSMLQWQRELRMTRTVDEVFDIVSRGDVVLRHQDLHGAISWLTGEKLEATVRRREGTAIQNQPGGLDMGGTAELLRVKGTGGVVIRTDRRTVNCDEFDYDVSSGIARLIAEPGRVVSIETQGSRNAVTAAEAIWDMDRDSIRIVRAAGMSGN